MERMICIMFGEKILDYWDDIMKDLGDIIAIPSVAQPQDGPYPFGKDAATAVDKAIEIAERYGIKTKNSDYYAMHAELGEGEENAVVMAHLDGVPAGEGGDSKGRGTERHGQSRRKQADDLLIPHTRYPPYLRRRGPPRPPPPSCHPAG